MPRLSLDLSDDLQSRLQTRATDTGHASLEQYVEALLRSEAEIADLPDEDYGPPPEQTVRSPEELEAKLLEAIDSPTTDMTAADWDEVRREVKQQLAARPTRQPAE